MSKNSFLTTALEELQAEANPTGVDVSAVEKDPNAKEDPTTTTLDPEPGKDSVAELMEQNVQLAAENADLEEEVFNNDVAAIQENSDSVNADLDEAVAVTAALEQLSELADLLVATKQVNKGTVATLAFGLEQLTDRVGLPSLIPALEADIAQLTGPDADKDQATSIGAKALDKSKEIGKKIVEGIKKILDWAINFFNQIFSRSEALKKKIDALVSKVSDKDTDIIEGKQITDNAFVKSLKLINTNATPDKQFSQYLEISKNSLFGFFSQSFEKMIEEQYLTAGTSDSKDIATSAITRLAIDKIFNGHSEENHYFSPIVVGGVLLELHVDNEDNHQFLKASVATASTAAENVFKTEGPIPATELATAKGILEDFSVCLEKHKEIQKRFENIREKGLGRIEKEGFEKVIYSSNYLKTFSAFATVVMPVLLRANLQNAANYARYVEKSIVTK